MHKGDPIPGDPRCSYAVSIGASLQTRHPLSVTAVLHGLQSMSEQRVLLQPVLQSPPEETVSGCLGLLLMCSC